MHTTPCTFPMLAASYQPHNTRSRPLHVRRTDPDQSQRQAGMYVNCRDHFRDCLNNYVKKEGGGDDNNKLKKHTRNRKKNFISSLQGILRKKKSKSVSVFFLLLLHYSVLIA